MLECLPKNTEMLVSYINTLLRDGEFESLEDLAGYYDCEAEDLKQQLLAGGYRYDEEQKRVL